MKYLRPLIFLLCLALAACATAPVTGRSQLLFFPESEEIALGMQAYESVLTEARVSTNPEITALVTRVGKRIAAVADKPDYAWEFKVIDDDGTANAFALPGGKVAVYTGILPYTKDENGLAFVLAHEVGHAIARHGGERMTRQMLMELGQAGLNQAIQNKSAVAVEAINLGYGIGTTVGLVLPFSRAQEYEADHIGIILMAKAGYDPRTAPQFFRRMLDAAEGRKKPPIFLSTHPADDRRIAELEALIPEAMGYYRE